MKSYRLFLVAAFATCTSLHVQWLKCPTPGVPRTPDGRPNLAAPRRERQTARGSGSSSRGPAARKGAETIRQRLSFRISGQGLAASAASI